MSLFAQKVPRKLPGNWTFLVVTDRTDLDDQIYKNFASVGAVTEPENHVRAGSGAQFQQLLRKDHRYVFSLIRKFHIEIEKLRGAINQKLGQMLRLNKARMDFYEQFQKLIAEYNAGASNVEAFFAQLVSFAQDMNQEEQRGIAKNLTEEELTLFDLLTRPNLKLSRPEREAVKQVAHELLDILKASA